VGSTVSVTWEDTILHDGVGYDLDLVDADADAKIQSIASGLSTSVHSFDWVVPDVWCVGCYLMVTQLNRAEHDYSDSALINIYGKPAVVESGGSGGSQSGTGGAAGATAARGGSGGAGNQSAAGAGGTLDDGTLPDSSAGSTSSAGSLDVPNSMIPASGAGARSGGGKGGAGMNAAPGASASSAGGSSSAGDGMSGAIDESAGEASVASPDSGGCTIDRRRYSRSRFALLLALFSFVCITRKRSAPGCK